MASGTLTSRILGLFRDIALGALFDRTVTDAWTAAFRIPNLFRRLLGEGSLSVSFIPVFMEAQTADPRGIKARNLVNAVYSLLLIVILALTLLGLIFIEPLFKVLLSESYAQSLERWELTVRMGRIMFGFSFFVTLYAFYMGLLNALGSFGLPALAPALLNVSMLIFTFLPQDWFPGRGDGLAWGVLIGGILQAGLLWFVLLQRNYLPRFQAQMWTPQTKEVFRRLVPGLMGLGLLQISTLVNLYFASDLPAGSISYIYWADRLLEFPLSLIAVSLGAALLPTLSEHAALGDWKRFRETAEESFLMSLYLAVPAALGLFFLAEPIIQVLFYRGQFDVRDLMQTAAVLKVYALSLLVLAAIRVMVPLYYARKETTYPMVLSVVSVLVHVLLAGVFIRQWGLRGLVASSLFAAFLNFMMLFIGLVRWDMMFDRRRLMVSVGKMAVSALGLWGVLKMHSTLEVYLPGPSGVSLFMTIVVSVIVYFGISFLLKSDEFFKIRQSFPLWRGRPRQKG